MKKGLIVALLVVAMVSMVLPVCAKAPIVNTLPTVIVGDNEGASGGMAILRYINAFGLNSASIVNWNNDASYTTDLFHAYYIRGTGDETAVSLAKPGSLIAPLDTTGYNALVNFGTVPAASTRITSGTADGSYQFMWMSFVDSGADPAVTNPYTDPVSLGHPVLTSGTYLKTSNLTLVAGVQGGTTLTLNSGSIKTFTVKCQKNANDSASGVTTVYSKSFLGNANGWIYTTGAGITQVNAASTYGIGFSTAAPLTASTFAEWNSPIAGNYVPGDSSQTGMVYRAKFTLASTAASSDRTLSLRVWAYTRMINHWSMMYIRKTDAAHRAQIGGETNLPWAGNNRDISIYWSVPTTLAVMGDVGYLAGWVDSGVGGVLTGDGRAYRLGFNVVGDPTDTGQLTLDAVEVISFVRPAGTVLRTFGGTTGLAFNAGFNARQDGTGGTMVKNASSIVLNLNAATASVKSRYIAASIGVDDFTTPTTAINPVANRMYRESAVVSVSDQKTMPTARILNLMYYVPGWTDFPWPSMKNVYWTTVFGFGSTIDKIPGWLNTFSTPVQTAITPCAFAVTGSGTSVVEAYLGTHDINGTLQQNFMYPTFGIYDNGAYFGDAIWGDSLAAVTLNSITEEDLGDQL